MLTNKVTFYVQADMDKKLVFRLLKDPRLEELLAKNIPSNTFLKAHFDGIMLVMPTLIMVSVFILFLNAVKYAK